MAFVTKASLALERDLGQRVRRFLGMKRPELLTMCVEVDWDNAQLSSEAAAFYLRQLTVACARRVAGVLRLIDLIGVSEQEVPVFTDLRRAK